MRRLYFFSLLILISACHNGKEMDLIIHNGKIHTMDDNNTIVEALVVKNGKIVEIGPERQILNKYWAKETIDLQNKDVFPGFTDAHAHMLGMARFKLAANLVGSISLDEMLVRLQKYDQKNRYTFLLGMGWDQNLWDKSEMPTNEKLNELFPDKPVLLIRIDGHAALVNEYALRRYKIDKNTKVVGGEILKNEKGELTGLLLDNAIELIRAKFPDFSVSNLEKSILEIQQELLSYGVTDVHEAGLTSKDFQLLDRLYSKKKLQLGIYGMLYPSRENIQFAKKKGVYINGNFLVRSFKIIGDGALGSRGAFLKKPYTDAPHRHGFLVTSYTEMERIAKIAKFTTYQLNIHAIGDSTNCLVLELIKKYTTNNPDHRWRIEHAQVLSKSDYKLLKETGAFPSVQPTHATSDCGWAEKRLGKTRINDAYAYKSILSNSQMGMMVFGTDFPIEQLNPFLTIHAAVNRTTEANEPINGFMIQEAVDATTCMKAMTIWAAFASFQEQNKGSIESGKDATFVVLQNPFSPVGNFSPNFSNLTVIKGAKVFEFE